MVDVDVILSKLRKGNLPTEQEIKGLCDQAREILDKLENVATLSCPITMRVVSMVSQVVIGIIQIILKGRMSELYGGLPHRNLAHHQIVEHGIEN